MSAGKGYPAYAGIDLLQVSTVRVTIRLPRIRGDRPSSVNLLGLIISATPHTRGSTPISKLRASPTEGYPAYAGIDLT